MGQSPQRINDIVISGFPTFQEHPIHQFVCLVLTHLVAWRVPLARPGIPCRCRYNVPSLGLPAKGYDLVEVIKAKDVTQEEVYTKYGTHKGSRGEVISYINDAIIWFAKQLLVEKLMHKYYKDEYPLG
jgi:hypothetical protein